ncbi:MAG: hypothetical protein Q8N18_00005, partial [Opitutaceae bacterium]|nr:hypothetical protein [Opitutaceae bacterium]
MKIISTLWLLAWLANGGLAEEVRTVPQPRVRLDPVTRAAVAAQAVKVGEASAQVATEANALKEAGDASPILMGEFVVREQGTGPREAPKQETFDGRFTPWKGGRCFRPPV